MTAPVKFANGQGYGLFTTVVSRDDIAKSESEIAAAPCIFQEYVPKDREFRVTIIGEQLFAVEIDSQISPEWREDWRRCRDRLPSVPHAAASLPSPLRDNLLRLVRRLGLVFGCVDLIRTPDGRYIFLEINPSGQWLWLQERTGLPLLEAFTHLLATGARDHATT